MARGVQAARAQNHLQAMISIRQSGRREPSRSTNCDLSSAGGRDSKNSLALLLPEPCQPYLSVFANCDLSSSWRDVSGSARSSGDFRCLLNGHIRPNSTLGRVCLRPMIGLLSLACVMKPRILRITSYAAQALRAGGFIPVLGGRWAERSHGA